MSTESDVAILLRADAQLMAILEGGVWTSEEVGVEGIRRGEDSPTNSAFDETGYLKPCAVIVEGDLIPVGSVRSIKDKITAYMIRVQIYYYEMRTHDKIDLAKQRVYELLEGERLTDTYEFIWDSDTSPFYDMGPVMNSTVVRQDWITHKMKRPS